MKRSDFSALLQFAGEDELLGGHPLTHARREFLAESGLHLDAPENRAARSDARRYIPAATRRERRAFAEAQWEACREQAEWDEEGR